jgi:hypothetical protein
VLRNRPFPERDQLWSLNRAPDLTHSRSIDDSDDGLGTGLHFDLLHPDHLRVAPLHPVERLNRAVEGSLKPRNRRSHTGEAVTGKPEP